MKASEYQTIAEDAKRIEETARLRAHIMAKTAVEAEKAIKTAEGAAESLKIEVTAKAQTMERLAEAELFAEEKRAQAIAAVLAAKGRGLKNLVDAAGGDVKALTNYLLVEQQAFQTLVKESANAMQGLKPTINVSQWNRSGSGSGTDKGETQTGMGSTIVDIMTTAPQIAKEMEKITGWSILPQIFQKSSSSSPTTVSPPMNTTGKIECV
jgi:flotillin